MQKSLELITHEEIEFDSILKTVQEVNSKKMTSYEMMMQFEPMNKNDGVEKEKTLEIYAVIFALLKLMAGFTLSVTLYLLTQINKLIGDVIQILYEVNNKMSFVGKFKKSNACSLLRLFPLFVLSFGFMVSYVLLVINKFLLFKLPVNV